MQNIESNGVQAPETVENAVLAGGLVNIVAQLKTMGQMVKFLCDRYVLDHFDYNSLAFLDYMEATHKNLFSKASIRDRDYWNTISPNLDKDVFDFIQFTHSQSSDDEQI